MDIHIHMSAGEIALVLIVWAIVAPYASGFGRAAAEDWLRRRRAKKL